jgi:gamma-glutamyltranspeptidase/glutathione hydrolase
MATRCAVSSGHYLATEIGMQVLRRGGNAADAAAAVGFALNLLKPHQNGIGGEAPTLVYDARDGRAWAISGNGVAPRAATLERFTELGVKVIPGDGFLPAVVPATAATWLLLLRRFGTMRLADVLGPTVELAEGGFPMYDALHASIRGAADRFRSEWPSSAAVFLPGGDPPPPGALFRNPDWGATFRRLIEAEARHADRDAGLQAAHDVFYRGPIAERICEFSRATEVRDATGRAHTALLTVEDFGAFEARVEDPVRTDYRGVEVCKCGPWCQGPVLLQTLNLLAGFDLAAMGHNRTDYVHTVVECIKLAYADRECYYGDPEHVEVPLDRLLSEPYAAERRALVDPARASEQLRPGGREPITATSVTDVNAAMASTAGGPGGDTTKLEVVDAAGNLVSATPSGGWLPSSPVIPALGFPLGTRGQMFSLAAGHPNCIAPGKRPRSTLTPSLAIRDGRPWLAFGSPGGDCQDQWALQFLLNVMQFGMSLQEAVEAPTFWSLHFPNSFYPRVAEPAVVCIEGRVPGETCDALSARGHVVRRVGDWEGGNTLAAGIDPTTGVRLAAASPRLEPASAAGW